MELRGVKILRPARGARRIVLKMCVPIDVNKESVDEIMKSEKIVANVIISPIVPSK